MQLVVQFIFGWPGILLFLGLASIAAWRANHKVMIAALFFSVGPSLYIIGGNGLVQLFGLYIPLSLGVSIPLIKHRQCLVPKILLIPMYSFYVWLGYAVVTQ